MPCPYDLEPSSMPEDLKINVGVGGAKEAEAALKGVAGAERAVGEAAGQAAPGLKKTAAAKTDAAEAAHELHMRDSTLLRSMAQISPECAILAQALNAVMTHTTATGVALGLLGVGIGAVTYAYSQFSAYQEAEKARAAAVLSGLKAEADAYEKVALGVEKAARARGGIGAGKGPGLARRAMQLDIPGVGPETRQRAAELLAAAGGPASDEDIENVALGITLGDEPTTGTERAKGRRMRRGDLGVRRGRMGAWRIEAAGLAASADRAMLQEQEAFRPEAEVARRLADLDTLLKTYPELQRQFSRWSGRTREAALMEEIRAHPEIGMEGFAPPFVAVPGTYYGRSPGGRRGIDIVENHFHGGVQTIIQDRKMEAGSVPVNRGR